MTSDDGFRRKTWDSRTTNTDMPSVPDTQIPRSRPPKDDGTPPLMWLIVSRPMEQRGMVLPVAAGKWKGGQGVFRGPVPGMPGKTAQFLRWEAPINPPGKVSAMAPHQNVTGLLSMANASAKQRLCRKMM